MPGYKSEGSLIQGVQAMTMRVINRMGAHELTPEEVDQVRGAAGTRIPSTSLFPPVVDGIIPDHS